MGLEDGVLFPPHFIPLLLFIRTCPLGKWPDYFCWENTCIHLVNTVLYFNSEMSFRF